MTDATTDAKQTPLLDLLRDVPADAVATYEVSPTHHKHIPYGRLCNEAATRISALLDGAAAMTDATTDAALIERLNAASHDERLSTGMLYREAAARLSALRDERDELREQTATLRKDNAELAAVIRAAAEP